MTTPDPRKLPDTIQLDHTISLHVAELLASIRTDERRAILHEMCGGGFLTIGEIREIVNSKGYDE